MTSPFNFKSCCTGLEVYTVFLGGTKILPEKVITVLKLANTCLLRKPFK
jgi:hypothetical protein